MKTVDIEILEYGLYVDGEICSAKGGKQFDCVDPSKGDVFAKVADADIDDMKAAVASARKAFDSGEWSGLSVEERGKYLTKIGSLIREHAKKLADMEMFDVGKTQKQATFIDIPTAAETFEYFGSLAGQLSEKVNPVAAPVKSLSQREPVGVVGCIIPWNYPLIMFAWKVAPALITGNTVVFKPSPIGCVSIMRLARIIQEAGFPKGVINVVPSSNNEVGAELVRSNDVDMISFTGSNKTGQIVMQEAARRTKKVIMELGGKSPNLVFTDCDFDAAIGGSMSAIFMNQGQMCAACSRLYVEEGIYDQFLNKLVERTGALSIGDAVSPTTDFGPVICKESRDHLLAVIEEAKAQGAKVAFGGKSVKVEGLNGFFIEPTILTDVTHEMKLAREEVFGPILCVMKFSSEEEAVRLANDSEYGLAACVWTKDEAKAQRVSRQLQCGVVWVNTYGGFYNEAPFGGCKQSGFGRELGVEGLFEFTQTKHICIDQTPGGRPLVASWF